VAIIDQFLTDKYALYQADCMEVMQDMPDASVHLSVYSPPFCGLYHYSSDVRDLSNAADYGDFFAQYEMIIEQLARITLPGRMTAVHCMDVPTSNSGNDALIDFPGDIIRAHERHGWRYCARYAVWKDPWKVRMRTMQKNLAHRSLTEDSSQCGNAAADYLLVFRRKGENKIPILHPVGLLEYAGARKPPAELLQYRGWQGKQTENSYSHWIWRQYASVFWDDVRLERVLPFEASRDQEDERHVHPLQLDVIERIVTLWSNPGEVVLTPFLGVGSETYVAVLLGRFGVGAELKASYFRQAVQNMAIAGRGERYGENNYELDLDGGVDVDRPTATRLAPHAKRNTWVKSA